MRRSEMRILFCISGVGRGHVARCRSLVATARVRGHTCIAAVPGRRAASHLQDLCPVIPPPEGFRRQVAPTTAHDFSHLCIYDVDMALSVYQADPEPSLVAVGTYVAEAFRRAQPDVVVVDQILVVEPIARTQGLPVVQVTQPPLLPGGGPWMSWLPERDPAFRCPSGMRALSRALSSIGITPPASLDEAMDGDLILVPAHPALGTTSRAMHIRPTDSLGPLADETTPPEPAASGGRPVIAISLSTATRRLAEPAIAGVLATGADALLVDGHSAELPAALAQDPRVTVLGTVDLPGLLGRCRAIVHHGGIGTAMAALTAGLPAVIVPGNSEQEHTGRRLAELGAAAMVPVSDRPLEPQQVRPGFVTLVHRRPVRLAERIAVALTELLAGAEPHARARQLGNELNALATVESALDAVEGTTLRRAA